MKVRMKDCKNCGKEYGATNGNQLYCCDVCRQQAYYKRHGIDRSQRPAYGTNVNHQFTAINGISPKTDVNPPTKEIEQISPAPVTQVKPLMETSPKTINSDNFGAILEQMNKTHQAQMEAMETRLKLSFAQETSFKVLIKNYDNSLIADYISNPYLVSSIYKAMLSFDPNNLQIEFDHSELAPYIQQSETI
jgi:hypothetical protein